MFIRLNAPQQFDKRSENGFWKTSVVLGDRRIEKGKLFIHILSLLSVKMPESVRNIFIPHTGAAWKQHEENDEDVYEYENDDDDDDNKQQEEEGKKEEEACL